jgi:hypothetical protein
MHEALLRLIEEVQAEVDRRLQKDSDGFSVHVSAAGAGMTFGSGYFDGTKVLYHSGTHTDSDGAYPPAEAVDKFLARIGVKS